MACPRFRSLVPLLSLRLYPGTSVGVQSDAYTEADEVSANFVNRPQLTCCVGRAGCTHVYTGELDDETAG